MKVFLSEFREFVLRRNMADLAAAVVLGGALATVVNSFVVNIITPPLGLLFGDVNFADLAIKIGSTAKISYGAFFQSFLNFIVVVIGLFLFIRLINRFERLALRKEHEDSKKEAVPTDSPEVSLLKEIRDTLREKNS
jgi:large conductance mechanosensitive channel